MKTIYKYDLAPINDRIQVGMPKGAVILSVGSQSGAELVCWARVDTNEPKKIRQFRIVGTGHSLDNDDMARLEFISTVQTPSGLVWHVYEQIL